MDLGGPSAFTATQKAFGSLLTLPVALFEEGCFRSLMYVGLRKRLSPRAAAVVSSAVFAVYHYQAISIWVWPHLFVYGFVACAALEGGLGLPWLILVHYLVDALWFYIGNQTPYATQHPAGLAIAAVALVWAWRRLSLKILQESSKGTA